MSKLLKMKEHKEPKAISENIKIALLKLSNSDGLKRTQRWLSNQANIGEVALSNKLSGADTFTETELKNIGTVLGIEL